MLDDVVMTPLDTAVTTIDFTDPTQIAHGDGSHLCPLVTDATLGLPSSLTSRLVAGRRVELTDTLNHAYRATAAHTQVRRAVRFQRLAIPPHCAYNVTVHAVT